MAADTAAILRGAIIGMYRSGALQPLQLAEVYSRIEIEAGDDGARFVTTLAEDLGDPRPKGGWK